MSGPYAIGGGGGYVMTMAPTWTTGSSTITYSTGTNWNSIDVAPAKPAREDELAWLRRRVSEVTELVPA